MPLLRETEHGALILDALKALAVRTGTRTSERGYAVIERYVRNDHPMKYVSSQFAERFGATLSSLCDNYCPLVVSTLASRLIVDSFTPLEKGKELDQSVSEFLNRTRFDALQRSVHKDAVQYGDAYLIIWPGKDGETRLYRQRPWHMAPVYDEAEPEEMICAVKTWLTGPENKKIRRFTIYFADRIERYLLRKSDLNAVKESSNFEEFDEDGEDAIQTHEFGRVPVAHFANDVGLGEFGISELEVVIPLQAMLNKQIYDLIVGMEAASWMQRYATGIEPEPVDPTTGRPNGRAWPMSRLWTSASKDAKFGQLEGPNPEPVVKATESTRAEIARVSSVPAYYLNTSGDAPSGAALRVTEAPLRAKVDDRQVHFGNVWENVLSIALGMTDSLSSVWRDTSPVSFGEQLDDGLSMKALGLPATYVIERTLGVTPEEAEQLVEERAEEDKVKADEQMRLATRAPMMQ